ncbi:aromatic amino acid exporter YddG [Arenibaculum pallidiluteum]|uniref:aromatic amino acid exporter YddG n=1 Tax=Arenibaculum pallidiluteum TaxID=2812559 RepID=UPI001A95BE80|nr:EamA family transporter [Arenibaculum pallidiluteum]
MTASLATTAAPQRHVRRATLVGSSAILMWSTLAALTALTGTMPPFQMVAVAFGIAFLVGIAGSLLRGGSPLGHLRQRPVVWLIGIGGLFGYHFFYFLAVKSAPAVEANLLNYLWPLLIVLFSALLPGERLRWWHAAGALLGLAGTVLLVTRGGGFAVEVAYIPGYLAALACAVTWAAYSVLSRRFGDVPTDAVGGFCLATAVLALLCHLVFETTAWPQEGVGWIALLALGIGPVGAAFFVWDHGVKHGDIRALGALSYATPLLSTLLLILLGLAQGHWTVWAACGLIVGGALLASHDMLLKKSG